MLVRTFGSAVYGVDAVTITVELFVAYGRKYWQGLVAQGFGPKGWGKKQH